MPDVLMLTSADLSNMAFRFSECLKMLDLDVRVFKKRSHMDYLNQVETIPMVQTSKIPFIFSCPDLRSLAKQSKVLHFTSGTYVDTGIKIRKKLVVLQYGGRPFVGNPIHRRKGTAFFNKFVTYTIVHHPYLLNQGAKNDCFIKPPVDTEYLQPYYERSDPDKIIIGHFPSNELRKGTPNIRRVLEDLKNTKLGTKFEYLIEGERVSWVEQLERIKKCDVVIECLTPQVGLDVFGEWSTATLESASMGKITVTNSFNENIYEETYGKSEYCIANDPIQLKEVLINLINMSNVDLQEKKIKTREWVVRCHGMEPTAKMLWNKVYQYLFPDRTPKLIYGDV